MESLRPVAITKAAKANTKDLPAIVAECSAD